VTASIVYGSKLVNAAFGFVTAIIIARILGPAGRADYFLTSTLAIGIFTVFNLGLEISIFWALSERRVAVRRLKRAMAVATGWSHSARGCWSTFQRTRRSWASA
jgi:O-antigen/teichoic acid export membrane protein